MEIISYIIAITIIIIGVFVLSWLFGNTFRNWNESTTYDSSKIQNKGKMSKTMIIGFIILLIIAFVVSKIS